MSKGSKYTSHTFIRYHRVIVLQRYIKQAEQCTPVARHTVHIGSSVQQAQSRCCITFHAVEGVLVAVHQPLDITSSEDGWFGLVANKHM
jgi:hypothetical protein